MTSDLEVLHVSFFKIDNFHGNKSYLNIEVDFRRTDTENLKKISPLIGVSTLMEQTADCWHVNILSVIYKELIELWLLVTRTNSFVIKDKVVSDIGICFQLQTEVKYYWFALGIIFFFTLGFLVMLLVIFILIHCFGFSSVVTVLPVNIRQYNLLILCFKLFKWYYL